MICKKIKPEAQWSMFTAHQVNSLVAFNLVNLKNCQCWDILYNLQKIRDPLESVLFTLFIIQGSFIYLQYGFNQVCEGIF